MSFSKEESVESNERNDRVRFCKRICFFAAYKVYARLNRLHIHDHFSSHSNRQMHHQHPKKGNAIKCSQVSIIENKFSIVLLNIHLTS